VTECELNAPGRHRAALRDDSQGPRRILLVDDEAMVRETMADLLQGLGYITLTADSGADALALLEAGETVDVLVTDLSMPEMDGLVLMKEARRGQPHLPVILLTGYSGDGAQTAITGEASDGFIVLRKPVTATHLADRIEALLTATTGASQG
jgi:CheY-like chemotaxis protein